MSNELLCLKDIKNDPFFSEHILWDVNPCDLLDPRIIMTDEGLKEKEPLKGYVFYIDTMTEEPMLFLMRHTAAGYAETMAQISEIPQELISEAIEENRGIMRFGMCPISRKVEDWLKKELLAL